MAYIDKEKAIDKILSLKTSGAFTEDFKNEVLKAFEQEPSADVVEVVRCKDCKHLMFSDMYGECSQAHMGIVRPDDYCSYGERKDVE